MPTAPQFEWPQGAPLFEAQWRAVTESLAGNGVLTAGDLALSPGTNAREVDYAAGSVFYTGTEHSVSAGTLSLSAGDGANDRWDTIAFDTATDSVVTREGTAESNPEPPDVSGDEILLGVVEVPQNFDAVFPADQIFNWQGRISNDATVVRYDDSTGEFGVSTVDEALDELQEAAQIANYPLGNSDLANSDVTVTAGRLLTGGGPVGLGGTTTIDAETDAVFEGREGGEILAGDQGIVAVDNLGDGQTAEVYKATLTLGSIAAAPTGLNMELVTFDNAGGHTTQATVVSGDGSTIHDRVSGDPLAGYTNSTGGEQSIGVIVDNQTGGPQEIFALMEGAAPA